VGSANIVTHYDIKGDGFWMAEEETIDLASIVSTKPDLMLGTPNNIKDAPHCEGEETELSEKEWAGAVTTLADNNSHIHVKLYNSGTTQHVSPFKSDFTSYTPLSPLVFLNTANQQKFPAIGQGTLVVWMPNEGTETELTLNGALHTPAISYMLVSIAALDEEGYHTHIGASHLELTSPQGERVSHVPHT